jgi:hypothetical protein
MSNRKWTVTLRDAQRAHEQMVALWYALKSELHAGHAMTVTAEPEVRTAEQNAAQWPILTAFSKQLQWPINGQMVYMTQDDWKDVLTAAFRRESARLAMGLDGGVVMLGLRTSKMNKSEFSEWLDFLKATAALRGVEVNEPETV